MIWGTRHGELRGRGSRGSRGGPGGASKYSHASRNAGFVGTVFCHFSQGSSSVVWCERWLPGRSWRWRWRLLMRHRIRPSHQHLHLHQPELRIRSQPPPPIIQREDQKIPESNRTLNVVAYHRYWVSLLERLLKPGPHRQSNLGIKMVSRSGRLLLAACVLALASASFVQGECRAPREAQPREEATPCIASAFARMKIGRPVRRLGTCQARCASLDTSAGRVASRFWRI